MAKTAKPLLPRRQFQVFRFARTDFAHEGPVVHGLSVARRGQRGTFGDRRVDRLTRHRGCERHRLGRKELRCPPIRSGQVAESGMFNFFGVEVWCCTTVQIQLLVLVRILHYSGECCHDLVQDFEEDEDQYAFTRIIQSCRCPRRREIRSYQYCSKEER